MLQKAASDLGVESFMFEGSLAEALNLPQSAGLLVQTVSPGSLAARLGLRAGSTAAVVNDVPLVLGGDVLLDVLGTPVTASAAFMKTFLSAIDHVKAGDTVSVRVWRGGRVVPLTTTVSAP